MQYAGASGDFNPIHTDEVYAVEVAGMPSVIAHGMLTMGMTGRAITDTFGATALRRFGGRFSRPVYPGDALTTTMSVTDRTETGDGSFELTLELVTSSQDGATVFTGSAAVELPPRMGSSSGPVAPV